MPKPRRYFFYSEKTWERHANPWSFWTRAPILIPLLALVWYHRDLGLWSLPLFAGLIVWTIINPMVFPRPRTTDRWEARTTFGEKIWMRRREIPIPRHHYRAAVLTLSLSGLGTLVAFPAAYVQQLWPTLMFGTLAILGKLWYLDRMAWLYADLKDTRDEFKSWLY